MAALAAGAFCAGCSRSGSISPTIWPPGGYQFIEKYTWLPALGISYHVGVDGMNAPLVLLTGIVMFTGVLISWGIDDRPREFFAFLFILATGVFGVFVSLDLFMLFFFYEIAVFPMYLLISIWGWKVTREYAAMKLTLYLFIGSVVALVGALAMYFADPALGTFDMLALETGRLFDLTFQQLLVPLRLLRLCRAGRHLPLPQLEPGWSRGRADGRFDVPRRRADEAGRLRRPARGHHAAAGGRQIPHAAGSSVLTLVNVVYGAFIASVQTDFKYVIGFSSVSHMGLVTMGFATLNKDGHARRGHADVLARRDDGSLLCCGRHGLRPGAHPRDSQAGRLPQSDAAGGDGLHHRRSGFDGHARLLRLHRRVPDLHGAVEGEPAIPGPITPGSPSSPPSRS